MWSSKQQSPYHNKVTMDSENELPLSHHLAEKENDLNLLNVKSKKARQIIDSDSEVDEPILEEGKVSSELENRSIEDCETKNETSTSDDGGQSNSVVKRKNRKHFLDSDSDSESNNQRELPTANGNNQESESVSAINSVTSDVGNHNEDVQIEPKKKKCISLLYDSDSEEELCITSHNKSFNEDCEKPYISGIINSEPVFVVDKKGQIVAENNSEEEATQKSRLSALCDSDSSADEECYKSAYQPGPSPSIGKVRPKPKKKNVKKSADEPKKMTGKEAQQQRQEIRSELQRMLRQSRVSLPYHKPKVHSIREFLQKRPRLSLSVLGTNNTPPSVAIKMSTEQLELVSKKLEERKKEVQEFYKSESESDEEDLLSQETKSVDDSANKLLGSCDVAITKESQISECRLTETNGSQLPKTDENQLEPKSQFLVIETNKTYSSETNDKGNINSEHFDFDSAATDKISNHSEAVVFTSINQTTKEITESSAVILQIHEIKGNVSEATDSNTNLKETYCENQKNVEQSNNFVDTCDKSTKYNFNLDDLEDSFKEVPETTVITTTTVAQNCEISKEQAINLAKTGKDAQYENQHNIAQTITNVDTCDDLMECDFNFDDLENASNDSPERTQKTTMTAAQSCDNSRKSDFNLDETGNATSPIAQNDSDSMEYDFNLDDLDDEPEGDFKQDENNMEIAQKQVKKTTMTAAENYENSKEPDSNLDKIGKATSSVAQNYTDSMDCEINLDPLGELEESSQPDKNNTKLTQKEIEDKHLENLLQKYQSVGVSENECAKSDSATKKLTKSDLLKQLGSTKPRLSGGPDQEIDLDAGVTKPSAVAQLMKRFMEHAVRKNVPKNKVQLDIINLSQGELHKETIAMMVDPEDEPVAILEKPGLKLQKLRNELQLQIAQRRSELWQQKHQPLNEGGNKNSCDVGDEKSDCGADDDEDFLDDDEEAELTDVESTEEEEDYEQPLKPSIKSAFIDEEAEESNDGEIESNPENDENDVCGNQQVDELDDNQDREPENKPEPAGTKKLLRRILKGFTEDSDDDDDVDDENTRKIVADLNVKQKSEKKLDSKEVLDEDDILPPNQLRTDKTPHKDMTQSKSELGFLTPIQYLTGVESFSSASKFLRDDSPASLFSQPPVPSPLKDRMSQADFPKKLFSDSCDTLDSQANLDDIAQLCSGKFPSPTTEKPFSTSSDSETLATTTQDLMNICSGSFPATTQLISDKTSPENFSEATALVNVETSNHVTKNAPTQLTLNSNNEIKDLDDDYGLISQLLNEEEMELFKKKFESPVAEVSNNQSANLEQEVQGGGRFESDSSDDEGEVKEKKCVKRLQKKLAFSDDESDSELEEPNNEDEQIDLQDSFSDGESESVPLNVNYDSEENEIELEEREEMPHQKLKTSDFFDNEAELSESDWDSADEDEKGLDKLEIEAGDNEVFDDNKMRSDLEKIHMRRVLDQDNREIKILQELLLEDGELHGTGRQRQFRWKNIDDTANDEAGNVTEIENYLDEEQSEEQWRRARHEREMYLKANQEKRILIENEEFLSIDSESQVLQMGHKVVHKSFSAVTAVIEKPKMGPSSPELKKPMMLLNTRGSFLARPDKFLTRLAEFNKVTTGPVVGAPKNSKKIVFQTLNHSTKDGASKDAVHNNNKRKADSGNGTPAIHKKLRLGSTMSPIARSINRKKQLFK